VKVGKAHNIIGYFVIGLSVLSVSSGFAKYTDMYGDPEDKSQALGNTVIFGIILVGMEVVYQIIKRYSKIELKLDQGTKAWTVEEIKTQALNKGQHIFVLDN
jgi:hypothetical protein